MMRGFGMEHPQAQIQGGESHDERVWDGAPSGSDTGGGESHDERVWDGAPSGSDTGG